MIAQGEAFALIERLLGFRSEPTRAGDVVRVVSERLRARGARDVAGYGRLLQDGRIRATETMALADGLTVNETYFFRELGHLDVIAQKLAPALIERQKSVRVLSVGCATGDEPYGLALRLHELGIAREHVDIRGLDASSNVIASARRGRYSEWALRNVPAELRARYFERERKLFRLNDELRSWVRFEVANLVDEDGTFWATTQFDIVMCRNLLIYLTPAAIALAIQRFATVLAPGGTLFLGHAETSLAGPLFELEEDASTFYFRRRGDAQLSSQRSHFRRSARPVRRAEATQSHAAERALLEPSESSNGGLRVLAAERLANAPAAPLDRLEELSDVIELIRTERFHDALARVEASEADERSERWLLRAVILTNLGRVADAVRTTEARVAKLPMCPFAHYLLGVCCEALANIDEARRYYGRAAELDPAFALACLRAGILARRAGRPNEARRALRAALERFPRQSARTQLLYGGGFSREALAALCRAELSALGTSGGEGA
ncbi:MAG: CheR family methyltransferase [Myxococcota bacterium]